MNERCCACCACVGRVHNGDPDELICVNCPLALGEPVRVQADARAPEFRLARTPLHLPRTTPTALPTPPNDNVRYIPLTRNRSPSWMRRTTTTQQIPLDRPVTDNTGYAVRSKGKGKRSLCIGRSCSPRRGWLRTTSITTGDTTAGESAQLHPTGEHVELPRPGSASRV